MTTKEFIGYFKMAKDKKAECEKHISKKYIPFLTKLTECDHIVKITMEDQNTKMFLQNTAGRYLAFSMKLISLYTDIEFKNETGLQLAENYDLLNECGALDILMHCIPVAEFKEFDTLLNMCVDDYLSNNRNLTSFIDKRMVEINQMAVMLAEKQNEVGANEG